mgnify:FL=1
MSQQQQHTIRMLNQIAANFAWAGEDEAAARVLDHITRFWSPAMRDIVRRYAEDDGAELAPAARAAALRTSPREGPTT